MLACVLGCSSKKSKFEESAGDLYSELEYFYDYFKAMNTTPAKTSAKDWCKLHKSWEISSENDRRGKYQVHTDNERFCIRIIDMKLYFYSADIYGVKHEVVCQQLKKIFGEPYREDSGEVDGIKKKFCEWKTDKLEVMVESDAIISNVSFLNTWDFVDGDGEHSLRK